MKLDSNHKIKVVNCYKKHCKEKEVYNVNQQCRGIGGN